MVKTSFGFAKSPFEKLFSFQSSKCRTKLSKLPSWHRSSYVSSKPLIQYKPFKDPVSKQKRKRKEEILEEKYLELLQSQKNESTFSILPTIRFVQYGNCCICTKFLFAIAPGPIWRNTACFTSQKSLRRLTRCQKPKSKLRMR